MNKFEKTIKSNFDQVWKKTNHCPYNTALELAKMVKKTPMVVGMYLANNGFISEFKQISTLTVKELAWINDNRHKMTMRAMSKKLGRSYYTVRYAMNKLGISPEYKNHAWNFDDYNVLIEHGAKSSSELRKLLPNHSATQISGKVSHIRKSLYETPDIWIQPEREFRVKDLDNTTYQILFGALLARKRNKMSFGYYGNNTYRDYVLWCSKKLTGIAHVIDFKDYPIMQNAVHIKMSSLIEEMGGEDILNGVYPVHYMKNLDELGLLTWYLLKGSDFKTKCTNGVTHFLTLNGLPNYDVDNMGEAVEILNKKFGTRMNSYRGRICLRNEGRDMFLPKWNIIGNKIKIPSCMNERYRFNTIDKSKRPQWWSVEEIEILNNNLDKDIKVLTKLLPNRSEQSIMDKINNC